MFLKHIKTVVILVIIIIGLFVLLKVFNVPKIILEQVYPLKYQEQVEKYAKEYEIDELFIYAIIKSESDFNKQAESISGAKGLMQIMDNTAKEIAQKAMSFLSVWFLGHVISRDKPIKPYLVRLRHLPPRMNY